MYIFSAEAANVLMQPEERNKHCSQNLMGSWKTEEQMEG